MSSTTKSEPTKRFTNRVTNYVAYRPKYPAAVVEFMRAELGLSAASVVADVGAGTGILTEMFLRERCTVFAVEPNEAMRGAAEELLGEFPNFRSVNGTAEATTLADASIDIITAAQAFHWFDAEMSRQEFARILKPGGWVALVWNMRRVDTTPFLRELEDILRTYGTDYARVAEQYTHEPTLRKFFTGGFAVESFENRQVFDYEGLRGRILSASYVPLEGEPNYEPLLAALSRAFDAHNERGTVTFEYDTEIYYGRLT